MKYVKPETEIIKINNYSLLSSSTVISTEEESECICKHCNCSNNHQHWGHCGCDKWNVISITLKTELYGLIGLNMILIINQNGRLKINY